MMTESGAARIRQATIEVLLEVGLRAATTRMVTDRAGVGRGLLNHYFRWPELRAEAWGEIFDAVLDDQLSPHDPPDRVIEHYLVTAFVEEAHAYWLLWLEAVNLAKTDSALASVLGRVHREMLARLAGCLATGEVQRLWTLPDAGATALRLSALYDGLAGLLLADTTALTPAEAEQHLRRLFLLETDAVPK